MTEGPRRPATERADELLSRAGWVAGMVGSMVGMRLARVAAFAREEAEDLWAEAQSMRKHNGGDPGAAVGSSVDAARERARPEEEAGGVETVEVPRPDGEVETVQATAAARRQAEALGVDLTQVQGTGEGGRITAADVKKKAKANFAE